jgi:hypothetical protein
MISDILLRAFAAALFAFSALITFYSLFVSKDTQAAAAGFGIGSAMALVSFAAHRRMGRLKEERRVFLSKFEGRLIDEALSMARLEARVVPRGLVAEKVHLPHGRWSAFEVAGFQFVLASDDEGRTNAYPLHL